MRFFNTAGPIQKDIHYFIDPLDRIDFYDVHVLIQQRKYFVMHAPRQTGKTSILLALANHLNQGDEYHCVYVNVEPGQMAREDVAVGVRTIVDALTLRFPDDVGLIDKIKRILAEKEPQVMLQATLQVMAQHYEKPLVLLIDEIDALVGDTLISVLRQLRAGYADRPERFPQSIILCGVRDVRDYRIHASSEKDPITGGSAFNIKAESLRLGDFSKVEVMTLLLKHTEETGQVFETKALERIWRETQGQPWLVNALAYEVTVKMKANRDRRITITEAMVVEAREALILRRETHLDQLVHKLKEPRVHRVIAPILAGRDQSSDVLDDDLSYVVDLGLVKARPQVMIANPIYREVIPRMLTWPIQTTLAQETHWYISKETGLLDMPKLLEAFQQFFREHSEHWTQRYQYKEAGAQLVLQAFLQRVINGGGRIEREYGLGRGRTDLLVMIPHASGVQRIVMELKLIYGVRETTIEKALPQLRGYMDRCGADEGHLVLFDPSDRAWEDKIFSDQVVYEGVDIRIWGM